MVNESEVIVGGGSGSGATAGAIDWTTYSFPQAVELTDLPEKFNGGIGFSRWQKRMKLWLTIKGLWPVVEYEKPVVDQEKVDTVKAFGKWAEKDGVARAAILAALTNTLFDVYFSDAYSAKLLWEKLNQTHNTDSQDLEKYSVARFLEFKLVDNKSMTEQVHEFEMIVHALKESGMDLPEKFKVMSMIEKLPKSWEEFSLPEKTEMRDHLDQPYAGHLGARTTQSKDCPTKKAKKTEVAQANAVLGTTSGPVVNMVVGEATASVTDIDRLFVSYQQSHSLTVKMGNASAAQSGSVSCYHEPLLSEDQKEEAVKTGHDANEIIFSEVEDEKPRGVDLLPATERQRRIVELQAKLCQAAAEVLLGSGSGLTVIDNLGQMSQSFGYDNTHIFVSLISIWNFLGRVGGGYFSEIIVRDYAYPRHLAMAVAQFIMAFGHTVMVMGWPREMYIGTLLIGLGYGAHWAIVPATAPELFGLKKFGALYNILTLANPAGTLVFSSFLASRIYDSEAAKQAQNLPINLNEPPRCYGVVCFSLTSFII
ncbi:hypothetical protein AgCh_025225 [Apium graveolens]